MAHLECFCVSEALLAEAARHPGLELIGEAVPLELGEKDNLRTRAASI